MFSCIYPSLCESIFFVYPLMFAPYHIFMRSCVPDCIWPFVYPIVSDHVWTRLYLTVCEPDCIWPYVNPIICVPDHTLLPDPVCTRCDHMYTLYAYCIYQIMWVPNYLVWPPTHRWISEPHIEPNNQAETQGQAGRVIPIASAHTSSVVLA